MKFLGIARTKIFSKKNYSNFYSKFFFALNYEYNTERNNFNSFFYTILLIKPEIMIIFKF